MTPSGASEEARKLDIDMDYMLGLLVRLLGTASPSGHTDAIVLLACDELRRLGIPFELTRRGAIRANLGGNVEAGSRAIVAHLDTLGAMVKGYKSNGRLEVVPVGTWAARSAEGARVTVLSDEGVTHRGTILPLRASGHTFNKEVDTQRVAWDNLEIRVDARCHSVADLMAAGIHVGDHVAIDTRPEITDTGFINARHLDDKAGVAAAFAAVKALRDAEVALPVDTHMLLTISEEVGVGASHVLHGDVAELVSIDNGTVAPGQYSSEYGVTISMQDSAGPFDWHLNRKLLRLCREHGLEHSRDVFRYYRSDAAAAVEAGNDIRTALVCFGADASHGYERVHRDSLDALAGLLSLYMQTPLAVSRDRTDLGPATGFPTDQPEVGASPPGEGRQRD